MTLATADLVRLSRRSTLRILAGAGAAAMFVPAWNETVEAADSITCVPTTPTVTEGPYWVDEKLFRSDIRNDPATGAVRPGLPLTLTIRVQDLESASCAPLAGAYVDIWHCDAKGLYSDEGSFNPGGGVGSVNTSGQKFLRGYQITDDAGEVKFTTIYPGWYSGRTIHIHVRVRTYNGSTVLTNFVSQIFFDDAVSDVALTDSSYSRTTARDTRNTNDNVYNVTNRERMLATVTGNNSAGYSAVITMGAAFQTPAAVAPAITAGGVANAVGGAAGLSAGAWIAIYGTNLATAARLWAASDLVNNALPTSLGGVSVQINSKPAYVQYISPTQINVLAPSDASAGPVAVTVTNAAGTSNSVSANLQTVLPGLSVLNGYVRAVRSGDNAIINGTGTPEPPYTTVSAAVGQGEVVSLFGTGFGPTSPAAPLGTNFTGSYPAVNPVTVTIGGLSAPAAYAGIVAPGLYQINVTVPAALGDGTHAVVATVNGVSSQSGAQLKVAAGAKLR